METEDRGRLHELLAENFSLDELKSLCFRLGLEHEELSGDGRSGKVRELITYMDRRGRLQDLLAAADGLRPGLDFLFLRDDDASRPLPNIARKTQELLGRKSRRRLRVVFIYHPDERLLADGILDGLLPSGHDFVFAPFGLPVWSDRWQDVVRQDIEGADIALLIQTRKSFDDQWVIWRADLAMDSGCTLIPVGVWGHGGGRLRPRGCDA